MVVESPPQSRGCDIAEEGIGRPGLLPGIPRRLGNWGRQGDRSKAWAMEKAKKFSYERVLEKAVVDP